MSDREIEILEVLMIVDCASIDSDDQQCVICLNPYEEHVQNSFDGTNGVRYAARLKCGHMFGQECIIEWLRENETW